MIDGPVTPRASAEVADAAAWIAQDNPTAAIALVHGAEAAANRIVARPALARVRLTLAPSRYRFWLMRGFPYLLVLDTERSPPLVVRFIHQARDLPDVLDDLG